MDFTKLGSFVGAGMGNALIAPVVAVRTVYGVFTGQRFLWLSYVYAFTALKFTGSVLGEFMHFGLSVRAFLSLLVAGLWMAVLGTGGRRGGGEAAGD